MNQHINEEIKNRINGDETQLEPPIMKNSDKDQRVLSAENPNFFFVRKSDFDAPNLYNLNLMKMYPRTRVMTFLPCANKKITEEDKSKMFKKI